jgi:hypothetical protein
MSETRINIVDRERCYEGTIHASIVDACIAALSAEPNTFAELQVALSRYIKPSDDWQALDGLQPAQHVSTEPGDAGIVIIDLAAQLVAWESTYSQPEPEGSVDYHDGRQATDVSIWYRIPDSWQFVESIELYSALATSSSARRAASPPLDARPVLYGRPLLEFIVEKVQATPFKPSDDQEASHDLIDRDARQIHALWLMTARADLRGQAPRDILLGQREFLEFDMHTRELQWSFLLEGPPCLPRESDAYRFAGFGTHENVMYYDLVRYLICCAIRFKQANASPTVGEPLKLNFPATNDLESQLVWLEQLKETWLETPGPDSGNSTPVNIIESERRRLPLALRPNDLIVDDNCPICVITAQEAAAGLGIGFQHFDGSHMDDDFAFSFFLTRESWEEENRRIEEFNRDFDRRWKERESRVAAGESAEIVDSELGFACSSELDDADLGKDSELIG